MPRPYITLDDKHIYRVGPDQQVFPSVTQIIKKTVPVQLAWWGMEVACEGIAKLYNPHLPPGATGADLVADLQKHRLDVNRKRDDAAGRGTIIHNALEYWATTHERPDLRFYPEEHHNRLTKLFGWLEKNEPEVLCAEVRTASLAFSYAGTFDLKAKMSDGTALIDLKTGKGVYEEQFFPQLEAYEYAEVECGEEPTDYRAVLHIPENGPVSFVKSVDTFDDFRVLFDHYKSIKARQSRLRKRRYAEKQAREGK